MVLVNLTTEVGANGDPENY